MEEIEYTHEGVKHIAWFEVNPDDSLVISLPDGTTRETWLRGLEPKSAAMPHLKSYAHEAAAPCK